MSDYQMKNPLTMLHRYKSGTNFTSVHYRIQCLIMSKCFFFFFYSIDGKASAYNTGDPGSIPGLGRSPGKRNGNPL